MLALPPQFAALLLRRGVWFWLGGRTLYGVAAAFAAANAGRQFVPPTRLGGVGSAWFVVLCAGLILLDVARRRERLLFANHGAGLSTVAAVGAIPAAIAELAVSLLVPA